MKVVWFLLAGVTGGLLGGMGFGGGTLLIPILTFLLKVPYRLAAWVNLVAFLPTAIVALCFHCKNKMVDYRAAGYLSAFALAGVLAALFIPFKLSEAMLRHVFGIFLIVMGSGSILFVLLGFLRRKRKK